MWLDDLLDRIPEAYRESAVDYLHGLGMSLSSIGRGHDAAASSMADTLAARAADPSETPSRDTTSRGVGFADTERSSFGGGFDDRDPYHGYFSATNRGASRKRCYQDAHQMDSESPEVSRALDAIAANASGSEDGTETTFSYGAKDDDSEIKRIMDGVTERTRLPGKAAQQIRAGVKFGDIFEEIVADSTGLIWDVNALPQSTMNRIEQGGVCHGFAQVDRYGGIHAQWGPRWIMHLRHNMEDGALYGRSQMFSARKSYTQLSFLDDGVVIMVLEHAGQKIVHTILVPRDHDKAETAKEIYKKGNIHKVTYDSTRGTYTSRYTPLQRTDYIVTRRQPAHKDDPIDPETGVKLLEGQQNFKDVIAVNLYFQRKILIALGVPPVYLGIEQDVNAKATVLHQELEFGRFLRRIQAQYANAYKERVYGFQFQLLGMNVEDDQFWVRFPAPSKTDERIQAEVLKLNMEAAKILNDSYAVPLDAVLVHFLGWGESEAEEVAKRLGAPTEETEGMGRRKKAEMLGQLREKLFAPNEIGTYFADWLSKMADAADYYRDAAA